MKTLTILKKNRKYFACKLDNGAKCKLVIDSNSENLETGTHTLEVEDRSVRTKYGTDLIFALSAPAEEQADAGICTLTAPYNIELVEACRELGGKFDRDTLSWVFSGLIADEVEELEAMYTEHMTPVEIVATGELSSWHAPIDFHGYPLAKATGRDSGAVLCEGVSKVKGDVYSGGSVKNWTTKCDEGTTFRLMVPVAFAEKETDLWTVTRLDNKGEQE